MSNYSFRSRERAPAKSTTFQSTFPRQLNNLATPCSKNAPLVCRLSIAVKRKGHE